MLRLGILNPSFPPNAQPCGVGDFTRRLAAVLAAGGTENVILAGMDYRGPERRPEGEVLRLARAWGAGSLRAVAAACRAEEVHALLVQYAPDLYPPHPYWINALPLAMKALAPGIPTVVSMHTVGVSTVSSMLGAGLMILSADGIVATNEEVTYLIGGRLKPCLHKTAGIPIGANVEPSRRDPEARREARARLTAEEGLPAETALLAHFGLYYPGKGAEQILDAAGAWKRQGRRFRLYMIGAPREDDGGFYARLQARGREQGLGEELVWTGYLPDAGVTRLLLGCDIFLAPYDGGVSSRRGSLMAALVHGLPVVSTPSRIPTEYFRAGENFEEVPFADASALAGRVAALLDDPGRRGKLSQAASALADRFAWPAIAEQTRAFVLSLLKK